MKVWQLAVVVELVSAAAAVAMALIPDPGTARTFAHMFVDEPELWVQIVVGFVVINLILVLLVVGFFLILRLRARGSTSE